MNLANSIPMIISKYISVNVPVCNWNNIIAPWLNIQRDLIYIIAYVFTAGKQSQLRFNNKSARFCYL